MEYISRTQLGKTTKTSCAISKVYRFKRYCAIVELKQGLKGKNTVEKQIENYFVKKAKENGALALKFTSPGNAGVPDRLVVRSDGGIEFVELKKPGGSPRPTQRLWIRRLESFGQTVTVIATKEAVDQYWELRDDS